MPDDEHRKDGRENRGEQERDMAAPAAQNIGPMPSIQPGIRIRWDLDQRLRAFVQRHPGTMRDHYERALIEYLDRHETADDQQ